MLRRGHTTSAIAETLDIAPTTVRRHVAAMVHKLGLGQRQPVSASLEKPFPA
jgi:DNA-binding NarL/FixJ family response regulator